MLIKGDMREFIRDVADLREEGGYRSGELSITRAGEVENRTGEVSPVETGVCGIDLTDFEEVEVTGEEEHGEDNSDELSLDCDESRIR